MTQSGHGSPFGYKVDFSGSTPADERVVVRYKAFEVYNKAVQNVDRCAQNLKEAKSEVNSAENNLSIAVAEMLRAEARLGEVMTVKGDDVAREIRKRKESGQPL